MCRSWQLTDVTFWGADFRFDLVGFDRRSGASAPADGSRRGRSRAWMRLGMNVRFARWAQLVSATL
jgi:hypothetical protein